MIQAHITVFLKEGVSTLKCPWYYRVCLYFLLSLICIYFYSHKSLFEEKRGKTAWMRESVRLFSLWVWIFWFGGGGVDHCTPATPFPLFVCFVLGFVFFLLLLFCLFFNIFLIYMYVEPFPLFLLVYIVYTLEYNYIIII